MLDKYEAKLLAGWEDIYKKSQLTMWLMLALKAGPKHMAAIKDCIDDLSRQTISADDKSMYRALRRLQEGELLDFHNEASANGPDRKVYHLTATGNRVLKAFLQRNVINVLYNQRVQSLIREET